MDCSSRRCSSSRCPEIQQGIVEIAPSRARSGSRTKIAVFSRDDSIDPVGACVGLKGSRVQAVVNELGGERIDIVPWSRDPERFAKLRAGAGARRARVQRRRDKTHPGRSSTTTSSRSPSARNGQNVRLASELTGWKIDLLLEPRVAGARRRDAALRAAPGGGRAAADVRLADIGALGPATVAVLEDAGYRTLNDIIDLDRDDFLRLPGIAPEEADRIMAMIDELTEDSSADGGEPGALPPA